MNSNEEQKTEATTPSTASVSIAGAQLSERDVRISLPKTTELKASLELLQRLELLKMETSAEFTGPIPPPHLLAEYGNIVPDFPERIMRMAEAQYSHSDE